MFMRVCVVWRCRGRTIFVCAPVATQHVVRCSIVVCVPQTVQWCVARNHTCRRGVLTLQQVS